MSGYIKLRFLTLALLASCSSLQTSKIEELESIEKRDLNWFATQINASFEEYRIGSINGASTSLEIRYLTPHVNNSDTFNADINYIGFMLYYQGYGVFHLIETYRILSDEIGQYFRNNPQYRNTRHSRAYYYFYDIAPEQTTLLVASGFCYFEGSYRFNSFTFNDVNIGGPRGYMNVDMYRSNTEEAQAMHDMEKRLVKYCVEQWRKANLEPDYRCLINNPLEISRVWTGDVVKRSTTIYDGCDICDPNSVCNRPRNTSTLKDGISFSSENVTGNDTIDCEDCTDEQAPSVTTIVIAVAIPVVVIIIVIVAVVVAILIVEGRLIPTSVTCCCERESSQSGYATWENEPMPSQALDISKKGELQAEPKNDAAVWKF